MKTYILYHWILPLFVFTAIASFGYYCGESEKSGPNVYICMGRYAKTYHQTPWCSGLENCESSVETVAKSEAEATGRRACKVCW